MGERVRAAVVDTPGTMPAVHDIELDDLQPDEVLVRIAATGICHTDLAWASGELFGEFAEFPVVLGHESAGTVLEVGRAVTRVHPGDRVVLALAHHCGHCRFCEEGHPMLCPERSKKRPRLFRHGQQLVQGFGTGGFAEATVVRDVTTVPIPDEVPLEVAALAGCAVATGLGAALNIAEVRSGSTVAVLGCGGIGVNVIMGAKVAGAEEIVAVDPNPDRRRLAERFGATDTSEPNEEALREFQPDGFDYVFECAGRTEPMELAVRLARRGGTVTLIGAARPDAEIRIQALDFVASQRRILGCLTGDVRPNVDLDAYFRLYARGRLDLDGLISARVPLKEIADGFARVDRAEGIRTLVVMDGAS